MKTSRKHLVLQALGASSLSALLLTSCGSSSASPEEVINGYAEALGSGDVSSALEFVADHKDVQAESVIELDGFSAPQISYIEQEFDHQSESITLGVAVDGEDSEVDMVQEDGEWKLAKPVYMHTVGASSGSSPGLVALLESDTPISTPSGQEVVADSTFITESISGNTVFNIDVTDNAYLEAPDTVEATIYVGEDGDLLLEDVSTSDTPKISDELYQAIADEVSQIDEVYVSAALTREAYDILSIPPKEQCTVTHMGEVDVTKALYPPYEFRVSCLGESDGSQGAIKRNKGNHDSVSALFVAHIEGGSVDHMQIDPVPENLNSSANGIFDDPELIRHISNVKQSLQK